MAAPAQHGQPAHGPGQSPGSGARPAASRQECVPASLLSPSRITRTLQLGIESGKLLEGKVFWAEPY